MNNSADGETGEVDELPSHFDNKVANLAKQILKDIKKLFHAKNNTRILRFFVPTATFFKLSSYKCDCNSIAGAQN